ncbi:STAS domain-containing protein [Methylomagnum sp.]
MPLKILSDSPRPHTVRLILQGQLDTQSASELDTYLDEQISPDMLILTLDLNKVDFVSSMGLRSLFRARKTMHARNGKICFANPSLQVAKVFELVKSQDLISVFKDAKEFDAYLTYEQKQVGKK